MTPLMNTVTVVLDRALTQVTTQSVTAPATVLAVLDVANWPK
jgi:hypothetical protein